MEIILLFDADKDESPSTGRHIYRHYTLDDGLADKLLAGETLTIETKSPLTGDEVFHATVQRGL